MIHADFHRAILDDPDDDLTRLVFADWLEERGEVARAQWMRLSIEVSAVRTRLAVNWDYDLSHGLDRLERESDDALSRCWPGAWVLPQGTRNFTWGGRGLVRLWSQSRSALRRLGGCDWLAAARDQGWVGEIRVEIDADYSSAIASAWWRKARGCPLAAEVPCSPSRPPPDWLLVRTDLHDITFNVTGTSPAADWCKIDLTNCHRLRIAAIDARGYETSSTRVAEAMWTAPGLRHLTILALRSDSTRSVDALLRAIVGHPTLRQLRLMRGDAATPAAIQSLQRAMPHLRIKTTY